MLRRAIRGCARTFSCARCYLVVPFGVALTGIGEPRAFTGLKSVEVGNVLEDMHDRAGAARGDFSTAAPESGLR